MNKDYISISMVEIFSVHNLFIPTIFDFLNKNKYWVNNRPVTQIPQNTSPISHNAPIYNRNVHNSVAKSCIVGYFSDALWMWICDQLIHNFTL